MDSAFDLSPYESSGSDFHFQWEFGQDGHRRDLFQGSRLRRRLAQSWRLLQDVLMA